MTDTLAQEVKSFRKKELKLTLKRFSAKSGISYTQCIFVEHGGKPYNKTYNKLSDVTGLPIEALKELKTKGGR